MALIDKGNGEMELSIEARPLPNLWFVVVVAEFPAGGQWCIESHSFVAVDPTEEAKQFFASIQSDGFKQLKAQVSLVDRELIKKV